MPGTLQSPSHHELHEVTEVKAWRSGIEPHIEGDGTTRQVFRERSLIGRERYQPAPLQFAEHVDHACSLPFITTCR